MKEGYQVCRRYLFTEGDREAKRERAVQAVLELLKEQGASDIKLIAGGIIPDDEIPKWKAAGVAGIFGPGSSTGEIVDFIQAQSGA